MVTNNNTFSICHVYWHKCRWFCIIYTYCFTTDLTENSTDSFSRWLANCFSSAPGVISVNKPASILDPFDFDLLFLWFFLAVCAQVTKLAIMFYELIMKNEKTMSEYIKETNFVLFYYHIYDRLFFILPHECVSGSCQGCVVYLSILEEWPISVGGVLNVCLPRLCRLLGSCGEGWWPVLGLFWTRLGCGLWVFQVCSFPLFYPKSLEKSQRSSLPSVYVYLAQLTHYKCVSTFIYSHF